MIKIHTMHDIVVVVFINFFKYLGQIGRKS